MQISLLLMEEIAKLFAIMLMGYAVVKAGLMKSSESKSISVVMVYLVIPCVIIDAFQVDYTPDVKKGLLLACAAAVLVHVLFLNVNIISIIVGVILFVCRIQMPSGVQDVMDMMNNMIGPIGMLLAGMVIADVPLKIVFTKKRNYLSTDIHGEEARCKRCFHILCHNPYFCFPVLHIEYRCHTNRTFQSFQGISYLGCRIS